jgi:hypothetical protein
MRILFDFIYNLVKRFKTLANPPNRGNLHSTGRNYDANFLSGKKEQLLKTRRNAMFVQASPVWLWLIGIILITPFFTGCSLAPPTPGEFYLPTPSFTPTIDPRDYTPTPVVYPTSADSSLVPKRNCTFPAEYWKDHPQDWQFAVITVGGKTYTKQEALVFFNTQPKTTFTFIYEQIFTLANNTLDGADPQAISQILDQMNRWLDEHPIGESLSDSAQSSGIDLGQQIENYNLGFIGPGLCAGVQAVATAEISFIPVEGTSTPTLTETPGAQPPAGGNQPPAPQPPTATPRPTRKPGGGGGGPAPTQPAPSATSAPPTATKAPPTSTKAPPTKIPTPTSPPLATPVPTKPPNPTQGGGPSTPTTAS